MVLELIVEMSRADPCDQYQAYFQRLVLAEIKPIKSCPFFKLHLTVSLHCSHCAILCFFSLLCVFSSVLKHLDTAGQKLDGASVVDSGLILIICSADGQYQFSSFVIGTMWNFLESKHFIQHFHISVTPCVNL